MTGFERRIAAVVAWAMIAAGCAGAGEESAISLPVGSAANQRSATTTDGAPAPSAPPSAVPTTDAVAAIEQRLVDHPPPVDVGQSWAGSLLRASGDEVGNDVIGTAEELETAVLGGLRTQLDAQAAVGAASTEPQPTTAPQGFRRQESFGGGLLIYLLLLDGMSGLVNAPQGTQFSTTETFRDSRGSGTIGLGVTADGAVAASLATQFEITTDDGRTANVTINAEISGPLCPNDDGILELEFSGTARAMWGSGEQGTQHFDGRATMQIDDDGEVATVDIDMDIEAGRTGGSSGSSYVELGYTQQVVGMFASAPTGTVDVAVNRSSSQFDAGSAADERMMLDATKIASSFIGGLVGLRRTRIQNNGCVTVVATAPGTASAKQVVSIDVRTRHVLQGIELDKRVAATLSGEGSIDPEQLPQTAGTIAYTAGDKAGDAGTIAFESRSRLGIGRASLTITVQRAYRIDQAVGDLSFTGVVCGFDKPFTLTSAAPAPGSITFSPASDAGGSYAGTGQVADTQGVIEWSGTYTVEGATTDRPTITMGEGTTTMTNVPIIGSAPLPGFWQGGVTFTLTPIDGC